MKFDFFKQKNGAMTIFEVLVVVVCVVILAAILLSQCLDQDSRNNRARRIYCLSNLRQINGSLRVWAGDHNDQYPMAVSVTNGGEKEYFESGNVGALLQIVSNEYTTTKILVCPSDQNSTCASNWNDLDRSHVSYFLGADATNDTEANLVFSGDDNLIVGGMPVKSGMQSIFSNTPVTWSDVRHVHVGNVGFADGSVVQELPNGLEEALQRTGLATNRIVLP